MMNLTDQYAQALYELGASEPSRAKEYVANVQKVLARRGHEKLLPRILARLDALEERRKRGERYNRCTPDDARTRTLVELYRTLVHSN